MLLQGLTGSKMEKICDAVHITLNKNAVQGDRSAVTPGKYIIVCYTAQYTLHTI
jgi:glycine/serine hydroxymethyltransferase